MTIAIHQPNFFPWYGYFEKIKKSDKFVFLDDVQVPKTGAGGVWNRTSININATSKYITAPLLKVNGVQLYNEAQYLDNNWKEKIKKTVHANYAKSKNYLKYKDKIFEILTFESNNLSNYNINAIVEISKILDLYNEDKFILSSSLDIKTTSEERIIDICKVLSAAEYYSGLGAKAYQTEENFLKRNITLTYQKFEHPFYKQKSSNEFISGLSILDYIFEGL